MRGTRGTKGDKCPGHKGDKWGQPPLGGVPLVPLSQSTDDLLRMAHAVERLAPSHRDPEAFHEAKSEIAYRLRMLAQGDTPSKDGKLKLSGPPLPTNVQLVSVSDKITDKKRDRHGA